MNRRTPLLFLLAAALTLGLSACRSVSRAAPLDTGDLTRLFYRDIDAVCDDPALSQAGGELLEAMADAINHKPASHHFGGQREAADEGRNMNQIGG